MPQLPIDWGLHWFRRDLRINGNAALNSNLVKHNGRVLGLFAFDHKFLSRPDFSSDRFHFFLQCLENLRSNLRAAGGDLLVFDEGPDEAFGAVKRLSSESPYGMCKTVSFNRDYEPFARARDERIQKTLSLSGIEIINCRDHLVIEPHELLKADGTPYHVYTPFARKWFELLASEEIKGRILIQRQVRARNLEANGELMRGKFTLTWRDLLGKKTPADMFQAMYQKNFQKITLTSPVITSTDATACAIKWAKKIDSYKQTRDIPGLDGTSKLSLFLKNGSLTTTQIIALHNLECTPFLADSGKTTFLKELVWREFYYHLMWHYPRIEHEAFQLKYKNIVWHNNQKHFEAWKTGTTGFPIVDAGMRQLHQTGWMHNRVRMIVASFLTKDLLIDWRLGEKWFMQRLLDGDLAPNNGGWQWAASTGCDAQPYFRIFNPESQSKRFDPDGAYIKLFVDELRTVSSKEIHNPSPDLRRKLGYPLPIVDHAQQRLVALDLYKKQSTARQP